MSVRLQLIKLTVTAERERCYDTLKNKRGEYAHGTDLLLQSFDPRPLGSLVELMVHK
jgi:hypothetical protein